MTKNQKLFKLKVQSLTSIKTLTHNEYTTPETPKRVTRKVLKQLDNEIIQSYNKLTPYYKRKFKLDEDLTLTLKTKKPETDENEIHKRVKTGNKKQSPHNYKPRSKDGGYRGGRKKGAKDKQPRKKPERKTDYNEPKTYNDKTNTFEEVDTTPVTQEVIDTSKYERLKDIIREGTNQSNQNIISELLDFEYINDMSGLLNRIDEYFSEIVNLVERFIYESESPDYRAGESEDIYTHLFIIITGKPISIEIQKDINNMFDRENYGEIYFPSSYAESVGVDL